MCLPTKGGEAAVVRCLRFGGGPHVLLAVGMLSKMVVIRLDYMIHDLLSIPYDCQGEVTDPLMKHVVCSCEISEVHPTGPHIVSFSWTHQLDGILVSDSLGNLQMWELCTEDSVSSLILLWSIHVEEVQDILSAGVSPRSPCASACSSGEAQATIWWPENEGKAKECGKQSELPVGRQWHVRPEKLRHPCRLRNLEWSPGVLRKDSLESDAEEHVDKTVDREDEIKNADDHPAIMTLDIDGCVRVWVEMLVVHHVSTEDRSPQLDSYFAMTLVVEPPSTKVIKRSPFTEKEPNPHEASPILFSTWAKPMDSILGQLPMMEPSKSPVLWLVNASWISLNGINDDDDRNRAIQLRIYAVRGLAAVVVSSVTGRMSGASTLRTGPKRPQVVLWGEYNWNPGFAFDLKICSALDSLSKLTARVTNGEDFPKLTCFAASFDPSKSNQYCSLHGSGITFVTALSEGSTMSPSSVHQMLQIAKQWHNHTTMPTGELKETLAFQDFVVALDSFGAVTIWSLKGSPSLLRRCSSIALPFESNGKFLMKKLGIGHREMGQDKLSISFEHLIAILWGNTLYVLSAAAVYCDSDCNIDCSLGILATLKLNLKHELVDVVDLNRGMTSFEASVGLVEQSSDSIILRSFRLSRKPTDNSYYLVETEIFESGISKDEYRIVATSSCDLEDNGNGIILCTDNGSIILFRWNITGNREDTENFSFVKIVKSLIDKASHLAVDQKRGFIAIGNEKYMYIIRLERMTGNHPKLVEGCIGTGGLQLTSLTWMDEEVLPCLAAGFSNGSIKLYSPKHHCFDTQWSIIGSLAGYHCGPVHLSYYMGVLVPSFGSNLGLLNREMIYNKCSRDICR